MIVFFSIWQEDDVKFGERNGWSKNKNKQCLETVCLHVYTTMFQRGEQIIVLLSFFCTPLPHTPSSPPSFGQLETEFIRFVLLLFSLPTAPFPHHSPVPLTVVIGSAGIIQRLDIIYCLPCTIPPPTLTPFLNRTRCPADELIILEILFLLLIPPFYEQLLFMVQWI